MDFAETAYLRSLRLIFAKDERTNLYILKPFCAQFEVQIVNSKTLLVSKFEIKTLGSKTCRLDFPKALGQKHCGDAGAADYTRVSYHM